MALKCTSRGSRWKLRPNDLNLVGVTSDSLKILGVVRLPVTLGKNTPTMRVDFYVTSQFSLPSDGLLGYNTLKSERMVIHPASDAISYCGSTLKAMDTPMRLASPLERSVGGRVDYSPTQAAPVVQNLSPVSSSVTDKTPIIKQTDLSLEWKSVNTLVVGNHEIPQRTAMHIPVSVPNATVGCDICLEGPSLVKALTVESTLNTVREGNRTIALVVNTTGSPVKLKQGVFLSRALAYNGRVESEPDELPQACVGTVSHSPACDKTSQNSSIDSHVKVVDYPELRPSLLNLLNKYREVIALPGESLGTTDKTEHHIRLTPDTHPIYIPAYRLPHSQRQIVDHQVKEMLEQGVIQNSVPSPEKGR